MSWIRLDDQFADHPKFLEICEELADAAMALWARALGYCNKHETDGAIPRGALRQLSYHEAPQRVAEELVRVGLWSATEKGWAFHDYLDYQRSAEELHEQRAATSELRRKAGLKSGEARRRKRDLEQESNKTRTDGEQTANRNRTDGEQESNRRRTPSPIPSPDISSCWSAGARDSTEHASDDKADLESGAEEAAPEAAQTALKVADGHDVAATPDDASLTPSRPGNGQPEPGQSPGVTVESSQADQAGPTDLIGMASYIADRGVSFGQKMLDWVASGRTLQKGHRDTLRRLYAERREAEALAGRAAQIKSQGVPVAQPASLSETERRALELWEHLWSRENRGETYPTTDRDRAHLRRLVARAELRAGEVGAGVAVDDVLRHYFSRYLKLDDKRLVAERYPLPFLESRLPAIGEYQAPRVRPVSEPAAAPPALRERAPMAMPDQVLAELAAPRRTEDALRARRADR